MLSFGFEKIAGIDIDIFLVEGSKKDVLKSIKKNKKAFLISKTDPETTRYLIEHSLVDAVISSEVMAGKKIPINYRNSGLNQVDVKFAADNRVAIIFNFNDVLSEKGIKRSLIISRMRQNAMLVKKYKAPFILCSGAKSKKELVSASDLIGFGEFLGFQKNEAKKSLYQVYQKTKAGKKK
jgi:RNase P/RNase MRP subunit p30